MILIILKIYKVVGIYIAPWKDGNHFDTFWNVCISSINFYIEAGFDVVFNYIINSENIELIRKIDNKKTHLCLTVREVFNKKQLNILSNGTPHSVVSILYLYYTLFL